MFNINEQLDLYLQAVNFTEDYDDYFEAADLGPNSKDLLISEFEQFNALLEQHNIVLEDSCWETFAIDLWFTRNGDDTGFWDNPEIYGEVNAYRLSKIVYDNFFEQVAYVDEDVLYLE